LCVEPIAVAGLLGRGDPDVTENGSAGVHAGTASLSPSPQARSSSPASSRPLALPLARGRRQLRAPVRASPEPFSTARACLTVSGFGCNAWARRAHCHAGFRATERRWNRTIQEWGCHPLPVLKTGWATRPLPLHPNRLEATAGRLTCKCPGPQAVESPVLPKAASASAMLL
jgi:hypothetical protein